jgi:hypothetical protein
MTQHTAASVRAVTHTKQHRAAASGCHLPACRLHEAELLLSVTGLQCICLPDTAAAAAAAAAVLLLQVPALWWRQL